MPTRQPTPAPGPGIHKVRLTVEITLTREPPDFGSAPVVAQLPNGCQVLDLRAERRRTARAA